MPTRTRGNIESQTVVVANGGTTTPAINLYGKKLVGIAMPAALTSTAMTFQVAEALGGTYNTLKKTSGALSVTVATNETYLMDFDTVLMQYFKIVLGSAEGAARTITLLYVPG